MELRDCVMGNERNWLKKYKFRQFSNEVFKSVGLILFILALRSSVVSTYVVPTGSMIPTILPGDRFLANQFSYGFRIPFTDSEVAELGAPQRGDIIVFPSPVEKDIDLVKRVIAVGGDTLEIRSGRAILNGKELITVEAAEEPAPGFDLYWEELGPGFRHLIQYDRVAPQLRNMPEVRIPHGHVFAMGDNRDHSGDSRVFGPVDARRLKSKALRILFSIDSENFPYLRFARLGIALN